MIGEAGALSDVKVIEEQKGAEGAQAFCSNAAMQVSNEACLKDRNSDLRRTRAPAPSGVSTESSFFITLRDMVETAIGSDWLRVEVGGSRRMYAMASARMIKETALNM